MQISLIKKNQAKTKYCMSANSGDVYLLNAIRRSAISLVPIMAIEDVEIRKNSSVLYDEALAHRLGLIPLKTDLKNYEMIKSPEDIEKLKCSVKLTLKAKGPKIVYSGDMKSADPAVVPVHEGIPIVKLMKGQEVELEATAILGLGRDHMKWSPGIVFYKNRPVVNVKGKADIDKLKEKLPEDSPLKISAGKVTLDDAKAAISPYLDAFVGEEIVPGVEVTMEENNFILTVESFGQLSPKDMMTTSIDALKERLNDLASQLK
ncbi:DNA-directed RNA polymerase subunit D [Candidatus Woesearchaeota archaeon]|nr:DNA-directed RNA polymerase subunit D [Candidatus Woesearchaeota archaeon]